MKAVPVAAPSRASRVLIGDVFDSLASLVGNRRAVIVTDETVRALHGRAFPDWPAIVLPPGESSKTMAVVERVGRGLLDAGADRATFVAGVGGGVVCDIAGFAASVFLRGVPFGFAATTLLAQVDAAIGGKNGVDLDGVKNVLGTFAQPEFTLCDPRFLATLPARELANGFAETVKTALVGDADLFEDLERRPAAYRALEPAGMEDAIARAVAVKAAIVARDEREETGARKVLNLGHTIGHAVEALTGLAHGEAVAIGLSFALRLSRALGVLRAPDLPERTDALLRAFGLPVAADAAPADVARLAAKDKKRTGGTIDIVLVEAPGRPLVRPLEIGALEEAWRDLRQPR